MILLILKLSLVCFQFVIVLHQVLEPSFRAPFGNVNRWFTTIVNQPQVKSVLGEVSLCTAMAKFDCELTSLAGVLG